MKNFLVIVGLVAIASGAVIPKPSLRDEEILDSQEEEAVSKKQDVSFISGLGSVRHHSLDWQAVKDLDSEELADFVAELQSLHRDNQDEDETDAEEGETLVDEEQEGDGQTSKKGIHHFTLIGLGFVNHHRPVYHEVPELDPSAEQK